MKPIERAKKLVNDFLPKVDDRYWYNGELVSGGTDFKLEQAKRCSIITVQEIVDNVNYFFAELEKDRLPNNFTDELEYWDCVTKEIENL